MQKMTPHPSREQLNAYNLGQLPPDEAIKVENHISECEPCCDTIISLSSDDTFVGLLKEARQLADDPSLNHDCHGAKLLSRGGFPPELAEHPRYEIVRLIGKGGMGDVYEAIHRKMERRVALKVINRELFQKTEAVNRFHREVKTAAQLSHPNIVTSHDADQAGDFHFMVMEYVDGIDLSQIVKDQGALPIADACDYIRQAANGLQHAHERGMVHRDIKPHNLMVTSDGTLKILDFGLASLAPEAISSPDAVSPRSDLTVVGAIMGTPDFISPEQAKDARQVDIRSDIYSLGATLYYMLSGRVPFEDGSVMHKLQSHAQIDPAPLDAVRAEVPEKLVAIVSRMMAKNPDERYLTPKQVAEALESFLQTWRPDEATSQGQEPSSGGNQSGSDEKQSRFGDAGWDWRLVLARVLLVIATIPVAIIFYEAWTFDIKAFPIGRVGDLVAVYLLPVLCLSTISGALFVFRRSNADLRRSKSGARRLFGMKPSEALSVAAVVVAGCLATVLYYSQVNKWTYVEANGSVVAFRPKERPQTVNSAVEGFVHRISPSLVPGAKVKEGEFLVELEPNSAGVVAELEARAKAVKADMETEKSNAKVYGENIIETEAAKVTTIASDDVLIEATKSSLAATEAVERGALLKFEQQKALLDKGQGKEEIEKLTHELEVAAAELKQAQSNSKAELSNLEVKKSNRVGRELASDAKVQAYRYKQKEALGRTKALERHLNDIETKLAEVHRLLITAPEAGTLIGSKVLKKGQTIQEGDELFTIVPDIRERAVELWISGDDTSLVKRGDHVQLQFEGWPVEGSSGLFQGRVATVILTADGVGNFRIVVKENEYEPWPDERYLRPGARANGWIFIKSR